MEKTTQVYILPKVEDCIFATISFDLWMPKGAHDIFALVTIVLKSNWKFKQMTIGMCNNGDYRSSLDH